MCLGQKNVIVKLNISVSFSWHQKNWAQTGDMFVFSTLLPVIISLCFDMLCLTGLCFKKENKESFWAFHLWKQENTLCSVLSIASKPKWGPFLYLLLRMDQIFHKSVGIFVMNILIVNIESLCVILKVNESVNLSLSCKYIGQFFSSGPMVKIYGHISMHGPKGLCNNCLLLVACSCSFPCRCYCLK